MNWIKLLTKSVVRNLKGNTLIIFGVIVLLLLVSCQRQTQPVGKDTPVRSTEVQNNETPTMTNLLLSIPDGYSSKLIDVKFREGTDIDHPEDLISQPLLKSIESIDPLVSSSSKNSTESNVMKYWFRITLRPGTDAVKFINELRQFQTIDTAEPAPLPQPPP